MRWIYGNLMEKWESVKRRHIATKSTAVASLQSQLSGYGSNATTVQRTLDRISLKAPLETWSDETVLSVVNAFIDEKFPTVLALNKIDHADADKNISKIAKKYPRAPIVLTSAISEIFLRRLAKQNYIKYIPGAEYIDTRQDLIDDGDPDGGGLKEMDEKLSTRVENLKDLVLYRHGSTGVVNVLRKAAAELGLTPVWPVRNIHTFGSADGDEVFRDCVLMNRYASN
ncbi:hypothetical protein ABW19_dt0200403 [Dactylella cylindrospora]|nr:hypothetical protein ABW19_dt0200403 [Dactylella cylindrospora]